MTTTVSINQDRLNSIVGQAVNDFGAIISSALVLIGDRVGLYRDLAANGPATPQELSDRTGSSIKYVRPWLINQAAAGYVDYETSTGRFSLSPEQELVFANEDSPASMLGGFELLTAIIKAEGRIGENFTTGHGMHWGEHDAGLFTGTARFFKTGYVANLVQNWLPALDGVVEKLERGALVADVGCGYGVSTIIMAQAYPNSRFIGYDNHAGSIEAARKAADEAGVSERVDFVVATAQDFPGKDFDLVAFFDCVHDMGDPWGAAKHARQALKSDGSVLMVEPMAGDRVEDNLNLVGRLYSAASVLVCTPHALAENGTGKALGTIATDAELREVFISGGFCSFRRATESPTNRVFEARL